jgi:hypothetical protein
MTNPLEIYKEQITKHKTELEAGEKRSHVWRVTILSITLAFKFLVDMEAGSYAPCFLKRFVS